MRAAVFKKYGPPEVLEIKDVPKPSPKDKEILIQAYASTVMSAECEMRRSDFPLFFLIMTRLFYGVFGPRKGILGQDVAGKVVAIGKDITDFSVGDSVFGCTGFRMSAHAEFSCLPSKYPIVTIPNNMTFNEAATVPICGSNALHFLKLVKIQSGQKVLIHAATGGIGIYAVQLAKYYGGVVTAVCNSADFDLVKSLGADNCIDYLREDFSQQGEIYDVIFDTIGRSNFSSGLDALKRGGVYLLANPSMKELFRAKSIAKKVGKNAIVQMAETTKEDLIFLKEVIEAGKLKTVIDSVYRLDDIVEAHRYVEKRTKVGHLVLSIKD